MVIKAPLGLLLLMAALLAAGCEMSYQSDDTSATLTDGTVTSFETRQGDIVITAPANTNAAGR